MQIEAATVAGVLIQRLRFPTAGRPLLFLHPNDGPAGDVEFLTALQAAGFDVHAPWLPGFGHSERPADFASVRDLACFAAAYLDDVQAEGAVVVGASFGGWIAADLSTRDRSRVAGLALIDALGVKFGGPEVREIADFHSWKADEVARRAWVDPAAHAPDPNGMSAEDALAAARSEEAFALYGWRPYMHDPGLKRWLARVPLPVLTLWGEQDGIVSPEYGRQYAALFPEGRFESVADAAHYPTRERPAATASRVAAFAGAI